MPTVNQLIRKPRQHKPVAQQGPGPEGLPAAPRRLHPGLHHDPEEAELGAS